MAVAVAEPQLARVKFVEPDTSKDPWDCGYVASPEPKEVINEVLPLHDLRPEIFSPSSPYTLRTHGFTAIKHKSVLHSFDNAEDVKNIYLPEVKELLKSITGAKSVHIIACDQRRKKAPTLEVDEVRPKGLPCGIDLPIHEMDLSKPRVGGAKSGANFGPARSVHIDYSPKGAGTMIRYNRKDIAEAAKDIIAAEDEAAASKTEYNGRRYGLFSVWRPLKTVGRDPISVCDPNSIVPKRDLVEFFNKQPGENGDFLGGVIC
jgi:hypothetical protein